MNRLLDGTGKEAIETLQLRLLTWPHMGKLEEVCVGGCMGMGDLATHGEAGGGVWGYG